MPRAKVIFLDAVGTLFEVKGSVGEVYQQLAQQAGVSISAEALNQAFIQSFRAAPPPVFPGTTQLLTEQEFEWWRVIAVQTFEQVGVLEQFSDFSAFFAKLYRHFATAAPWFVYPEIQATLTRWQQLGLELGVLSNFDSRLYSVLSALDLDKFFASITISTEVGAAKPDPQIFAIALSKHQCPAELAWHIGDSFKEDYQGAKAAGLKAIWLQHSQVKISITKTQMMKFN